MKRCISIVLALLCAAQVLTAVPARPGKFTKTLPDGRKVTVQLHGDEFRHWMTDESGRVVREDSRGFLVPSSMAEVPVLMGGAEAVNRERMERIGKTRAMTRRGAPMRSGNVLYFPLILVQFADLSFTVAETDELIRKAFDDLVNQDGYSENGATGSLNDYYRDNTLGLLEFHFDVFGPVTVSESYAYYGTKHPHVKGTGENEAAAQALAEALQLVAAEQGEEVFNPYDNDGDGRVDAVFMFYAGHNEAEGGGEDTIWPHEWSLSSYDYYFETEYASVQFGNVRFNTYSCASEYKWDTGNEMCGIGTAVHEFGHALGLPDLYDTNYNNIGDGQCGGVYNYSPMCNGSYNNNGRTPVYFTMEERVMMGWAEDFTPMPAFGTVTIPSVDTNVAFREDTQNPGEYFVFECRKGTGWDAYVSPGLVVYHVDRSANPVFIYTSESEGYWSTAEQIWSSHRSKINCNIEHPCYYLVPATDQGNLNFTSYQNRLPFPGAGSVTEYRWQGWAPEDRQGDKFYGISFDSATGTVTLRRDGVDTAVAGRVLDKDGAPVAGATVSVYAEYLPAGETVPVTSDGGPARIARRMGTPLQTVETDADGKYALTLEGLTTSDEVSVEVSAPGCLTVVEHVALKKRAVVHRNFQMLRIEDPIYSTLTKYDGKSGQSRVGVGYDYPVKMGGARFSAEELEPYVGLKIVGLQFVYYQASDETLSGVKGIIDFGTERVLVKDVPVHAPGAWNYLDVSGEDLRIPADMTCRFGYALMDFNTRWPYLYAKQEHVPGGLTIYEADEIPAEPKWWDSVDNWGYGPLLIAVVLENGAVLQFNYINAPNGGNYAVGDSLDLNLVPVAGDKAPGSDVSWYLDDEPVSGTVILSKAGKHTLEARFTTVAGRRKVIERQITVE